ncbi:hypothetical protein SynRS9915_01211 [Synechococcus sp. RS9915]|nr:hypothetical protein SynRS9915_01211 [Synechococcus sp. RS9915]
MIIAMVQLMCEVLAPSQYFRFVIVQIHLITSKSFLRIR